MGRTELRYCMFEWFCLRQYAQKNVFGRFYTLQRIIEIKNISLGKVFGWSCVE